MYLRAVWTPSCDRQEHPLGTKAPAAYVSNQSMPTQHVKTIYTSTTVILSSTTKQHWVSCSHLHASVGRMIGVDL